MIDPDELSDIADIIETLPYIMDKRDRSDLIADLTAYVEKWGDEAARALGRFVQWARGLNWSESQIASNVGHDLNGGGEGFSPRTLKY
jgi:hypothetical protein